MCAQGPEGGRDRRCARQAGERNPLALEGVPKFTEGLFAVTALPATSQRADGAWSLRSMLDQACDKVGP